MRKSCTCCKQLLPRNNQFFYKDKQKKDKLTSVCINCKKSKLVKEKQKLEKSGLQKCSSCNQIFSLTSDYWYKQATGRFGFCSICKVCISKKKKLYHIINKSKRVNDSKLYYKKNKNLILSYNKKYKRNKYQTDFNYRLRECLRNRIIIGLKNNSKAYSTIKLLGCSIEDFKQYLESQFKPGMSWLNYGYGNDKWNIDHVIPISSFDLTDTKQQQKCFHYTNLQPLWQTLNFTKSNKILTKDYING